MPDVIQFFIIINLILLLSIVSVMWSVYSDDCRQFSFPYGNEYSHWKCLFNFDCLLSFLGDVDYLACLLSCCASRILLGVYRQSVSPGFRQLFNYLRVSNDYNQSVPPSRLSKQTSL